MFAILFGMFCHDLTMTFAMLLPCPGVAVLLRYVFEKVLRCLHAFAIICHACRNAFELVLPCVCHVVAIGVAMFLP